MVISYKDFTIIKEGARGYNITLPCFSSEDNFYIAQRMNRFYSKAMGTLFESAQKIMETDTRRAIFRCSYEVIEGDDKMIVKIIISISQTGKMPKRKSVAHIWNNGRIISKEIGRA